MLRPTKKANENSLVGNNSSPLSKTNSTKVAEPKSSVTEGANATVHSDSGTTNRTDVGPNPAKLENSSSISVASPVTGLGNKSLATLSKSDADFQDFNLQSAQGA